MEDDAESNAPSEPGEGVGLKNVRDRLVARFDGQAHVAYGQRDGGGFRVDLTIPLQTHV